MDVGLHRAEWQGQYFGGFLVGASLDMTQEDAGSILRSERSNRSLDGATELLGLHRIEGGFLPGTDLERRGLHGFRRLGMGGPIEREGIQLPAAQMIDGRVIADLEDPG